ncbi:MAG: hypothetical protein IKB20_03395 [Clostridia bacterium]|nr:hypothetical protein [Clostridia bacterium]
MEVQSAEKIKLLTLPLMEKGFVFEYSYQKGGDSSCVYICRYKKDKNFFDWREVSGGEEINLVTCVDGVYGFPSVKALYPKQYRAFKRKHLFKRASIDERRAFIASILLLELNSGKDNFFGIPL